jgi:CRP-like cAMP-binding protein
VQVEANGAPIATLGPGQHFGEMALIDKAPRSADVRALDPSSLLAVRRREFFDIIRKDHAIAVKILWSFLGVLNERLRNTSRELGEAREHKHTPDLADVLIRAFDKPEDE